VCLPDPNRNWNRLIREACFSAQMRNATLMKGDTLVDFRFRGKNGNMTGGANWMRIFIHVTP